MSEIERAIEHIEDNVRFLKTHPYVDDSLRAHELALEALKEKLSRQENAPLTIEEIISMNGKPVWCQTGDGYEGWALVIVDNYQDGRHYLYLFSDDLTRDGINEAFEPDEDFYNLTFKDDPNGHFGLHVLGWRAYRYEPKGEKE